MEPELGNENRNSVLFQSNGIGTRISEVASAVGTRKYASSVAGVSTDTLQRYISEDVKPSFEPIAKLALAGGYSMEWIATGFGDAKIASQSTVYSEAPFNHGLMIEVIEELENALQRRGQSVDPKKKAELIMYMYNEFLQSEETDDGKVVSLLKLIS